MAPPSPPSPPNSEPIIGRNADTLASGLRERERPDGLRAPLLRLPRRTPGACAPALRLRDRESCFPEEARGGAPALASTNPPRLTSVM
ncbi:hypothetical protein [Paenibacillus polymyxa]|uniref:hypothetical protein n=1 Tax=Paenibacillus polymyxa TaxID=1406 RepID=UPI001E44E67A